MKHIKHLYIICLVCCYYFSSSQSTLNSALPFQNELGAQASEPVSSFLLSTPSICAGGTLVAIDLSKGSPTSWTWQTPGANTSSTAAKNPILTYTNPGTYTISLTASNLSGTGDSTKKTITVLANPTVIAVSEGTFYCAMKDYIVVASGAVSYSWNTGESNDTIYKKAIANKEVEFIVTGTDANGCAGVASIRILASDLICAGLKEQDIFGEIYLASNPVTDILKVHSKNSLIVKVKIYDINSELLLESNLNSASERAEILTGELPVGLYYLVVSTDRGVKVKKVLKQ
jgi:hypothetical protein